MNIRELAQYIHDHELVEKYGDLPVLLQAVSPDGTPDIVCAIESLKLQRGTRCARAGLVIISADELTPLNPYPND